MPRIHVRGGRPLAGYSHTGARLVVVRGDWSSIGSLKPSYRNERSKSPTLTVRSLCS